MKKQKFSIKTLLFKSVADFKSWFCYITKKFTDMKIIFTKNVNRKFLYKVKYSI